jgi:hypothetical protein
MSAPTITNSLETRTIVIDRLERERSGATNGKSWTLYRVHAHDLDGDPIGDELRTFQRLAGTVEVTFSPRNREGKLTYTLRRADNVADIHERRAKAREAIVGPSTPTPANGCPDCAALAERLANLEGRFELFLTMFDPERSS